MLSSQQLRFPMRAGGWVEAKRTESKRRQNKKLKKKKEKEKENIKTEKMSHFNPL
jgi:hypothetical protein